METHNFIRLVKALIVLFFAGFSTLVVFGNITDYYTNFEFVQHVLSMDNTFNDSIMYRAITSDALHHVGYIFIILIEAFIMVSCWIGGIAMLRKVKAPNVEFVTSKKWAIIGLTAGIAVWFFGFQAIAGEWFGMWMNKNWNGIPDATRLTMFLMTSLIFITLNNDQKTKIEE